MMASTPCAACKFLRRKCTPGCVFAPYFPPDNPGRFAQVHRVFGASNVAKLLNDLQPAQREDAVNSLAYEAEARLHDPVFGCVGYISMLQHRLMQLQQDLTAAKKELSTYLSSSSGIGNLSPHNQFQALPIADLQPGIEMGLALGGQHSPSVYSDPVDAQQLAEAVAVVREQEMLMNIEHQHHDEEEMARLMRGSPSAPEAPAGGISHSLLLFSPQHLGGLESTLPTTPPPQQHQQPQSEQFLHQSGGSDEGRRSGGDSSSS